MLYFSIVYLYFIQGLKNIKNKKILTLLCISPMFFSLAFQIGIGEDYYSYIEIFKGERFYRSSKGVIFKIIIVLLKNIFNNERSMFVTIAIIQMYLFYKIVIKLYEEEYIENIPLFILLFVISTTGYKEMFNTLRSSIAVLFFQLGTLYMLQNKLKTAYFLAFLGGLFHPGYIICSILFSLRKILKKKINSIGIVILIFLSFIMYEKNFLENFVFFLNKLNLNFQYRWYLNSRYLYFSDKGYGIGLIIQIFFYLVFLLFYRKEEDERKVFLYNLGYLLFIYNIFVYKSLIFNRLIEIKYIFYAYMNYKLVVLTFKRKYFYFGSLVIIYYTLFALKIYI